MKTYSLSDDICFDTQIDKIDKEGRDITKLDRKCARSFNFKMVNIFTPKTDAVWESFIGLGPRLFQKDQ